MKNVFLSAFIVCLLLGSSGVISAQTAPFTKGVNLTNWFQAGNVRQIQFSKYTFQDFQQIQSLGCDVIRLPINLHFMTSGAPDYVIDPLLYTFLDQVVSWSDSLGMHLILDNHTFDPAINTDPNVGIILAKVWKQMAAHFVGAGPHLYYEILNEPHGISDALWGSIQGDIIDTIRTVDPLHTIIVGGAGWNGFNNLALMPHYQDPNLIYTFHFYEPFVFTHQGASWVAPSMVPLANVPFPYQTSTMPPVPPSLAGSWIGNSLLNYQADGTVQKVQELLDIALQFQQTRNVPIFCGEFGVYIPNSQDPDRVAWYDAVRSYMDHHDIAWTMWDYHGGFGLYKQGGNDLFDHDLNTALVAALGLQVPPQSPYVKSPDQVGRILYSDFLGAGVYESSYGSGRLDYYSDEQPNDGEYCIKWENASQYEYIGLDFIPNRDLSFLVSEGYALDLMVRGDLPGTTFDIRFIDTKTTDPNDHPWRMRHTIAPTDLSWDRRWHHLHLPLSSFVEHGAWDNNTWHQPEGKFDWADVDRLEIVAEHQSLAGATIWFDQIVLTDQDTAVIKDSSAVTSSLAARQFPAKIKAFPNPFSEHLSLLCELPGTIDCRVLNFLGQEILHFPLIGSIVLSTAEWPAGVYFVDLSQQGASVGRRLVLKQ